MESAGNGLNTHAFAMAAQGEALPGRKMGAIPFFAENDLLKSY